MKSFKNFIKEDLEMQSTRFRGKRRVVLTHNSVVDSTPVQISFYRLNPEKTGQTRSFSANFTANGDIDASPEDVNASPEKVKQGSRILRHVIRKVSSFVSEQKPSQLHLQANSPNKVSVYRTFAQTLARKHGGRVEEVNHPEGHPLEGMPNIIVHLPGKTPATSTAPEIK